MIEDKDFLELKELGGKLKKAILKLKDENESLRGEIAELKTKKGAEDDKEEGKGKGKGTFDKFDRWLFGEPDGETD